MTPSSTGPTRRPEGWTGEVEVLQVIRTELECRGDGTDNNPIRRVTQYWTLDGLLLMEFDPCAVPR